MSEKPGERGIKAWHNGHAIAILAPTWAINPRLTKESFAAAYAKHPAKAARDYGSEPSTRVEKFLKSFTALERRVNEDRKSPINYETGEYEKWFAPGNEEYFIHSDLSATRDSTGFAMCHWDYKRDVCVVDLMHGQPVPPGSELEISAIRKRIFEVAAMGFGIYQVGYDRWQSLDSMQILRSKGYKTQEYSVDKNTEAYDTLLELALSGKLDFYYYEVFMREFKSLELLNGKKVDHPKNGSKDVTDAVAGCVAQCVKRAAEGGGRKGGGSMSGTSLRRRTRGRAQEVIIGG